MARSFNGSTQYLEHASLANPTLPITIAAWFYANSTSGFQRVVAWQNAGGTHTAATILLNYPSAGYVSNQVYTDPAPNSLPYSSGTFSASTWNHACVVSGATSALAYLNGVAGSATTYSAPTFTSTTYFEIGRLIGTQYFSGRVAEVGVWSTDLTAAEIGALSDGYTPLQIRPASLVAYWPLGGHYGQLDLDRWKNRYDMTPSGSPTWADHPRVIYPRRSFWFPSPIPAAPTSYTLEALPASVDVVGQSAALSAVRRITAQPATIEVVGQEATLRVIRKIVASPATVDVVGQAATLSAVRRLAASPATIEVVGQAATLRVVRKIVASPATVDVVGQSATLTRARTLTANAAEVQVSGQAAGLTATRKITASPAAIEVVGQAANLRVVRRIVASPATVEVVGQSAVTRRTALLQGLAATIAVVGQAAVLTYSGEAAVVTEDWIGVDKATGRTPKATATHRVGTATAIGRVSKATAYQRPQ